MTQTQCYDLVIVGGGINGTGIAMEAASRGLRVLLCEQQDLAEGTSSRSSKLIHGGLRYLEHGHLRLVRESLSERETLLHMAPHIVWPLRFRLPLTPGQRPAWMLRVGLWLYDHLSRRNHLPASRRCHFADGDLKPALATGFEYSDAWVDDARLVVLCARQAADDGARILPRCRCVNARRNGEGWQVELRHRDSGQREVVAARAIVNASGPWINLVFDAVLSEPPPHPVRLVKGSHIVVPSITHDKYAYILQNSDGRVVFVLPYETDYSLIGTTETAHAGDPANPAVSAAEEAYLLASINQHFGQQRSAGDICYRFAGVRPLLDDRAGSMGAISRDYRLELSPADHGAPLLSVYGGKITSFRRLAEKCLDRLAPFFPALGPSRSRQLVLPGGDFSDPAALAAELAQHSPWLDQALLQRWVRSYGTHSRLLLAGCHSMADLGTHFGGSLTRREVDYLRQHEWALSADDILWRRTKQGLRLSAQQQALLTDYLASLTAPSAAAMVDIHEL